MKTIKNNTLEYEVAQNISVPHCFTTRLGGVSTGILESLNIAYKEGESMENVEENIRILARELSFDPERLVLTRRDPHRPYIPLPPGLSGMRRPGDG